MHTCLVCVVRFVRVRRLLFHCRLPSLPNVSDRLIELVHPRQGLVRGLLVTRLVNVGRRVLQFVRREEHGRARALSRSHRRRPSRHCKDANVSNYPSEGARR